MKSSVVVAVMIVLCLAMSAFAQSESQLINLNFDFAPGGARAEGMGRTGIALSDDINGGSGNPAGLSIHDETVFGFGWGVLSPRGSTVFSDSSGLTTKNHVGSFNALASINFVAPVRIKGHKFVGTINYSRVYDEYLTGEGIVRRTLSDSLLAGPGFWVLNDDPANVGESHGQLLRQGGLNVVNLGFGTKIYSDLSFGLTINIYSGTVVNRLLNTDRLNDVYSNNYVLGQHAEYVFRTSIVDTLKFSGLNFNLGLKYEKEKWSAGLLVRTPMALNLSTERTAIVTLHIDDFEETGYRNSLLSPKINPPLTKYDLPMMIAGGFAYKASENLLLTTDLEFRPYGSGATIRIRDSLNIGSSGDNTEFFTEYDPAIIDTMQWKNTLVVRLGAEYTKEFSFGTVPLRAGFGYVPVPSSSVTYDEVKREIVKASSDPVSYNLSMGTGIHWEQIRLDMAYTYTIRDKEYTALEFEYKNHHINISFTGVF